MALSVLFNQPWPGSANIVQAPTIVAGMGSVSGITPGPLPGPANTPGITAGMRTYGRIGGAWVEVQADANGLLDQLYLTALAQVLKLNLGESPFYANSGIPAQQSVITQVFPDFYAIKVQNQFAPFFASLVISRIQGSFPPAYNVNAVAHSGAVLQAKVAT